MTTTRCADEVSVPDMVRGGLNRVARLQHRAMGEQDTGSVPREAALSRLAELYRREARWWDVLVNWVYSSRAGSTSVVFGRAAIVAHAHALQLARQYDEHAEHAASARRRAALDGVGVVA